MWTRYTERARRAVWSAQEEAVKLGERYIGTEHLLLGLIRDTDTVAIKLLAGMGVLPEQVRSQVERQATRGRGTVVEDVQLTPRGKRVLDLAYEEARRLNNDYIGTEHLLLGLIGEGDGLAGRVLVGLGATQERTRGEVDRMREAEAARKAQAEESHDGS